MGSSINSSKENNKENESAKPNPIIENIKSKYILSKIYDNIPKKKNWKKRKKKEERKIKEKMNF